MKDQKIFYIFVFVVVGGLFAACASSVPPVDTAPEAMPGSTVPGSTNIVMAADFNDGTCQWVEAGGPYTSFKISGDQFHSAPYSYFLYGRKDAWNGVVWNQGSYLAGNKTYIFSAWVYQETENAQTAQFAVTVNQGSGFTDKAGKRFIVAETLVQPNTWTLLQGEFTAPEDGIVYRPAIAFSDSLCDFYTDDISIRLKDGMVAANDIQDNLLAIKDAPVFKQRNLLIGSGIGNTVLSDPTGNTQKLTAKHFNSIAISNSFKPQYIMDYPSSVADMPAHNERVALNFSILLPYMNFARENNLVMSAQALLWYNLTPAWFFHVGYDEKQPLAGRDLMLKRMENYIKDVLEWCKTNYPGMFKMWVVANESIQPVNGAGAMRNDNWFKTVGEDYVAKAFEYAGKYKENGMDLVYNDFNLESNAVKIDYLLDYIDKYKVKLDAIGFQMHVSMDRPNKTALKNNLEKTKARGLGVYISEMDVDNSSNTKEANAALRSRYYDLISTILGANINLKGINWWCLTDGYTWLTTSKGGARYPLMFDINNQAKPAYYGVIEAAGAAVPKQ